MSVEPGEENTAEQSAAEPKRPARKPAARTPAARKPAARKPAARKPAARKPAATPEPEAQVPPVPIVPAELAAIAFTVPPLPPLPEPEPVPEPEPEPAAEPGPEPEPEPEPEPKSAPVAAETASVPVHPFAVRLRELVKTYGDEAAVDGIDLTIPTGSVYALVGPNGAGKTTTLSAISGLLTPDRGRVEIHGVDLAASPRAAKALLGVLPDRLRTFDRLTGRQLLFTYGALRGMDRPVIAERTEDLARAFDLGDALNRPVADYSAGMTKKVMLAGALIHAPRVLILDEPFEAVDPLSSAVILDILQTYVDHGGTVVLSTHGMDVVERFCTHIAVLVDGRIIADGTVDEVRAGRSLPERFVELAGGIDEVEGLEWLHTFSA